MPDTEPKTDTTRAKTHNKKPTKKEAPPRLVNGFKVPPDAQRWTLIRFKDPAGKEGAERMALHDPQNKRRVEWFPIDLFPPSWPLVLQHWGSGTYRIQWWGDANGHRTAFGLTRPETLDDPEHPPLPAYRGATAEKPAPAPVAAAPPQGGTVVDAVMANAKDGKIDVALVAVLFQLQQAQLVQQQQWFQQREAEERARRADLEDDHARRLAARQQEYEQARQRDADFWAQQTERAAAAVAQAREATDDGDMSNGLAEAIEDLREDIKGTAKEQREWWQEMIGPLIPMAAAKFFGQQPPAIPPASNGSGS